MPPTEDDSKITELRRLVALTFATEDFEQIAEKIGIAQKKIVEILSDRGVEEIWRVAASQQIEVEKRKSDYSRKIDETIGLTLKVQSRSEVRMRSLVLIAVFITAIAYVAIWYLRGSFALAYQITEHPYWFSAAYLVIGLVFPVVFYLYRRSRFVTEWDVRYNLQQQESFQALRKEIEEAEKKVEEALISQGVKPKIREILDSLLHVGFTRHLPKLNPSGLSEVFDSENEVATDAKRQLEFMMATMPGGSIGIAGPRGSGKSTLLRSACKDMPDNLSKRKVMPLLTTSPVEYAGRDFILHLFSSMCVKMLETIGRNPRTTLEEMTEPQRPRINSVLHVMSRLAPLAGSFGILLTTFSVVLVLLTMNAPQSPPATSNAAQPAGATQSTQNETAPQPSASPHPSPTPTPRFVVRFVQGLDIKPGTLFIWGVLMVLFYVVIRLYFQFSRRLRVKYEEDRIHLSDDRDRLYNMDIPNEFKDRLRRISDEAKIWLKDIKFQQSYTSGWSGGFKFPIGLEGGTSGAVSLAQQHLSLPDITKGFCSFVSAISKDLKVVIGIDELDKLESDESAQRFLNEIKAVFGLSNVFYLISVSENAMSNFERRGVPFRDVFDSSFDNIIYVDYLSLEYARRLVARRVIGMPPPFVQLCYCISGGLARDLVRVCRNLMQYSHKAHETSLDGCESDLRKLSGALIKSDLQLKLHALTVATKDVPAGARLNSFLTQIHKLENELDSPSSLIEAYQSLMNASRPEPSDGTSTNGGESPLLELPDKSKQGPTAKPTKADDAKTLHALNEELASYIYYCVTILEFFNDVLNENTFAEAEQKMVFDELARARQYLAVNATVTRSMLDKVRKSFGIQVPSTGEAKGESTVTSLPHR